MADPKTEEAYWAIHQIIRRWPEGTFAALILNLSTDELNRMNAVITEVRQRYSPATPSEAPTHP